LHSAESGGDLIEPVVDAAQLGRVLALRAQESVGRGGRQVATKPIPTSMTTMAISRPPSLVTSGFPYPTVVTVAIAHHTPSHTLRC
jgi:hypothetical protein